MAELERGTIARYWDVALVYVNKLLADYKAMRQAEVKAKTVNSRRGR